MTMTQTSSKTDSRTYPSAFYAAAGVGDLAYEQLRKLPELADKLRVKASELADQAAATDVPQWKAKANEYGAFATSKAAELTAKVDAAGIRDSIVSGTQTAAEKASKFYDTLVARGEQAFTEQQAGTKPAAPQAEPAAAPKAEAKADDVPPAAKPAAKKPPRAAK
ncbi:hypothetical protein ACFQY4_02315 [Catellatospora bangladeshensis]|uniref:Uncharacterized protein n=1 Tax=Catellatospora bangladeshensis TaxID=310355 RepID=A0A8J3JJ66_9ACTN|nr:hypothetical protein [Catellatospora bangladeshensis]GIF79533.1 hypothetical protein Cba03nite_08820 [Catellatospora bangladeshensis]